MKALARHVLCIALAVLILFCAVLFGRTAYQKYLYYSYPQQYADTVERWAAEYELDPLLLYSFIRTESGFDKTAESSVGARGLMQITEVTFDWIKAQIASDESISFDDLYDPETNVRFGGYYVKRCLERYHGDTATAAAAYHSGWGTVDSLLACEKYSQDGQKLDLFPYTQMQNYVVKIDTAYARYQQLYRQEGEISA